MGSGLTNPDVALFSVDTTGGFRCKAAVPYPVLEHPLAQIPTQSGVQKLQVRRSSVTRYSPACTWLSISETARNIRTPAWLVNSLLHTIVSVNQLVGDRRDKGGSVTRYTNVEQSLKALLNYLMIMQVEQGSRSFHFIIYLFILFKIGI